MLVGFYLKDKGLKNIDMSAPELGNPGIGGTQFCYLMVCKYLKKHDTDIHIIIYHYHENKLPEGITSTLILSEDELIEKATQDCLDLFVFQNGGDANWYQLVDKYGGKCICWVHNYLPILELNMLTSCNSVKRVVFVGKEQYDFYIDHKIIYKSTYIYNPFLVDLDYYGRKETIAPIVTYTGCLVYGKGFHVLAKEWKAILKSVPDAQLYVLGSGKLYSRDSELGKYNLSDAAYENQFIHYLIDQEGKRLPSVHFFGVVSDEKYKIYNITSVGVVNPTARTEIFCLCAVEIEACNVPIVTKKAHGLLDTVKHNQTGILFHTPRGIRRAIITLLKNKDLNLKLGDQAKTFVLDTFSPEQLTARWKVLLDDVCCERNPILLDITANYLNTGKWLKIAIRTLKNG